jgi:hypothetical protein
MRLRTTLAAVATYPSVNVDPRFCGSATAAMTT